MGPWGLPIRRPSVALIRLQISGVPMMRNRDWNGDGFTAARVGLASFVAQAGVSYRPEYGQAPIFRAAVQRKRACQPLPGWQHRFITPSCPPTQRPRHTQVFLLNRPSPSDYPLKCVAICSACALSALLIIKAANFWPART
jgi:hypothetical protein